MTAEQQRVTWIVSGVPASPENPAQSDGTCAYLSVNGPDIPDYPSPWNLTDDLWLTEPRVRWERGDRLNPPPITLRCSCPPPTRDPYEPHIPARWEPDEACVEHGDPRMLGQMLVEADESRRTLLAEVERLRGLLAEETGTVDDVAAWARSMTATAGDDEVPSTCRSAGRAVLDIVTHPRKKAGA